jgi:hypothetical protein
MSSLGDSIAKRRARRPPEPGALPAAHDAAGGDRPLPAAEDERSELRRRRDALAEEVTELHWDLGGLAYEMATRDYFRLDVLVRRAAVLQERDAELAEIERLLALEHGASAGACPGCAAPHSRGALFCWQCGATLMERAPSTAMPDIGFPPIAVGGQRRDDAIGALPAPDPRINDHARARRDGAPESSGASLAEE